MSPRTRLRCRRWPAPPPPRGRCARWQRRPRSTTPFRHRDSRAPTQARRSSLPSPRNPLREIAGRKAHPRHLAATIPAPGGAANERLPSVAPARSRSWGLPFVRMRGNFAGGIALLSRWSNAQDRGPHSTRKASVRFGEGPEPPRRSRCTIAAQARPDAPPRSSGRKHHGTDAGFLRPVPLAVP